MFPRFQYLFIFRQRKGYSNTLLPKTSPNRFPIIFLFFSTFPTFPIIRIPKSIPYRFPCLHLLLLFILFAKNSMLTILIQIIIFLMPILYFLILLFLFLHLSSSLFGLWFRLWFGMWFGMWMRLGSRMCGMRWWFLWGLALLYTDLVYFVYWCYDWLLHIGWVHFFIFFNFFNITIISLYY